MLWHPMRSFLFPLLFSLALGQDPASYVNLFIGTTNDGHVFPGQYLRIQHLKRTYTLCP